MVHRCLKTVPQNSTPVTVTPTTATPTSQQPKILCIPYVKGLCEKLDKKCRSLNIRITPRSRRTLQSLLMKVKSRRNEMKEKGVVYKIQCERGDTYVGEMGGTLETRLKEHTRAVIMDDSKNGREQHLPQHPIGLHRSPQSRTKLAQEEGGPRKHSSSKTLSMNLDSGFTLNPIWNTLNSTPMTSSQSLVSAIIYNDIITVTSFPVSAIYNLHSVQLHVGH